MRCKGKTKAGARCKRSARAESEYCATHADQAEEAKLEGSPTEKPPNQSDGGAASGAPKGKNGGKADPERDLFGGTDQPDESPRRDAEDWVDVLADLAMVGTVVVVALVFGRVMRVF